MYKAFLTQPLAYLFFYASYGIFPFLLVVVLVMWEDGFSWAGLILLGMSGVFVYARFIERYRINIQPITFPPNITFSVPEASFVLLSDFHLGVYKGQKFLQKIVRQVNALKPDFVLIAGDFVYATGPEKLPTLLAPLKDLEARTFAVQGNHDLPSEKEFLHNEVAQTLESFDIRVLDDQILTHHGWQIIGLKDYYNGPLCQRLLPTKRTSPPTMILTHNPDRVMEFPADTQADVVFTGHTHGGQIRLPKLYRKLIPCHHAFDEGWHFPSLEGQPSPIPVFVSSGLGEVGLPLRIGIPPTIYVFKK